MIFIQSNEERTLPHHFDAASALFGAIESDQKFKLISYEDVSEGKYDRIMPIPGTLFVGSVEFMQAVFKRLDLKEIPQVPRNNDQPYVIMSFGEARELSKISPQFVKPAGAENIKLFSGTVMDQSRYRQLANVPINTPCLVYEPFKHEIVTEWRAYIFQDKLVDLRHYSGDFTTMPKVMYIEETIKRNKGEFPVAYTADFAKLSNGETLVVEYNDMWAIGNYGIPNDLYVKLLMYRYREIIKNYYA